MSNCNVLELFNNVTSNCDNDIEVVKDDYKNNKLLATIDGTDTKFSWACLHVISVCLRKLRPLDFLSFCQI